MLARLATIGLSGNSKRSALPTGGVIRMESTACSDSENGCASGGAVHGKNNIEALWTVVGPLLVFEESAHLVPYEEPEKFLRVLVDRVRPLAGD